MEHPFTVLKPEFTRLISSMVIKSERLKELKDLCQEHLLRLADQHKSEWDDVETATGVPRIWGIPSFEREGSSDYRLSPAQGDRWDRISVNVPRHLGPYRNWGAACIAAYRIDHLDRVERPWSWERIGYEAEAFNGFGPRGHGKHSGYVWAGTNIYDGGMYVHDGKWSPGTYDHRFGVIPIAWMIAKLRPELAPVPLPVTQDPPKPDIDPPQNVPDGVGGDVTWVQQSLNKLGLGPIDDDGSYGRHTRRVVIQFQYHHGLQPDGVVGPVTIRCIQVALNAQT
jgi:lysozyme family protein